MKRVVGVRADEALCSAVLNKETPVYSIPDSIIGSNSSSDMVIQQFLQPLKLLKKSHRNAAHETDTSTSTLIAGEIIWQPHPNFPVERCFSCCSLDFNDWGMSRNQVQSLELSQHEFTTKPNDSTCRLSQHISHHYTPDA